MAQRRPRKAQFPRRISRRPYAPFCKVRVRFGLLSLLRRVRWIALGALCAKGLWCRNAQANAATVPPMGSLRQYGNVIFDTLALCEHTECRMPTDRSAGFSNLNRTLGSGELATGQETPACLSCLELGAPSEASAGFLNFNRTLGSGALATGQETLPIRVLGSACFFCFLFFNRRVFFCFPFFSKRLSLPCGDTKDATRTTEPPFAF